jgi:hypothetical protein
MMSQNPYMQTPPQQPQQPPAPAPPPPYQYGPGSPQRRKSTWPTVIGILSVVFASMALVCLPAMTAWNAANPHSKKVYSYLPDWYRPWEIVSMFGGIVFAILLLSAGVTLLKRRPVSRALHLAYGGLSVAISLINTVILFVALSEITGAPGPVKAGMIGGGIGGTCGGLIYPIFLLVWFSRAVIAREVNTWR